MTLKGYFITLRVFGNPDVGILNTIGNFGLALSVAQIAVAWSYIYFVWYAHGKWTGHPGMLAIRRIVESIPSEPSVDSQELEFLRSHPR